MIDTGRRAKTEPAGSTIDLDKLFRKDSGARKIAEALLTGEPLSRQDLGHRANLAVTSVNRVIESLEREGATFDRALGEDGRQAVFRLLAIGNPRHDKPYPALRDKAKIVRAELVGDSLTLDFIVGDCRYRGTISRQLPGDTQLMGRIADVTAVALGASDEADVTLAVDGRQVLLRSVHQVG